MSVDMSRHASSDTLARIAAARTHEQAPSLLPQVPFRNLRHLLSLHASATPDAPFLIHYDANGQREALSYAEFNMRVHQAAGFLYDALGVRRGERVATLTYNHLDTVVLYFACWLIGASVAPQNPSEDDRRIAFILRSSGVRVFFVHSEYMARARSLVESNDTEEGLPQIEALVLMGERTRDPQTLPHFGENLRSYPTTFIATDERPTLQDEALLVYTSGTTGAPKGVMLTQYNLLVDAQSIAQWNAISGQQRMMCVLPIHHVNGIVVTLITPLYAGASTVLNRAFSPATFWARIAAEKVHIVSVVPTLLQFCLEYARTQAENLKEIWGDETGRQDLRHFRHLICGAGTLSMSLVRAFEDRFGFPVLHGYGLSETTCYSCFLPIDLSWDEHRHWLLDFGYPSIGCPVASNEMAIFDAAGNRLGEGVRGEICIRGHNVMSGYDQRPDANAEAFAFGWFRSGDEGFFQTDTQGRSFFFITGRIKELINRGGVKFSPFEIEEVLLTLEGVNVALAIAFANDYYGEEIGAYIVLKEGAVVTETDILAYCRARMPFEKCPKVVLFGTEIPVTSTGKYQRLQLRQHFTTWQSTQFRP
jgi:long-chain acyl-CoA synthetase